MSLWGGELPKSMSSWVATYNLHTRDLQLAGSWVATRSLATCNSQAHNSYNSHTLTFSDLPHCDIQPHLEILMLHQLVRNMFRQREEEKEEAGRSHLQISDYNMTVQSTVLNNDPRKLFLVYRKQGKHFLSVYTTAWCIFYHRFLSL